MINAAEHGHPDAFRVGFNYTFDGMMNPHFILSGIFQR